MCELWYGYWKSCRDPSEHAWEETNLSVRCPLAGRRHPINWHYNIYGTDDDPCPSCVSMN